MGERHNTGGNHEFHYEKEDLERIRKTDTDSTKAFKEGYAAWQQKREEEKLLDAEMRRMRLRLLLLAICLVAAAALLIALMIWM